MSGSLIGVASTHALTELFSVLTRMPLSPPITPTDADQMIHALRPALTLVSEDERIVAAAITRCAVVGAVSGAVFDAIHVVSAEAMSVDVLVTFNERHFRRLSIASTPQLVVPPDPPAVFE
jgi:predicted nucleic acid-binding protein